LMSLVRWEYIPAPAKDSSGDYVWLPEDVERARHALADRRRGGQRHGQPADAQVPN
jgi:hypothetical protein